MTVSRQATATDTTDRADVESHERQRKSEALTSESFPFLTLPPLAPRQPMRGHRKEEAETQYNQECDLRNFIPKQVDRGAFCTDRVVNDPLGQFKRQVL